MRPYGLKRSDIAVISVLWGLDIVDPWTDAWGNITLRSILGNLVQSRSYAINIFLILCAKCAISLAAGVIVDFRNRKFTTYFISLIVYALTPLFAIAAIITEYPPLAFVVPWFMATCFVTTPLRFCCIFNQKPRATADQTRLVVAVFEFVIGLSSYWLTMTQEDLQSSQMPFLIVIWTIKIPIFVLIITLTDSIKGYVNKEVVTEPTVKAMVNGIRQDLRSVLRKKYIRQFILFTILFQPILIITFIDGVLAAVDFDSNRNIDGKTLYKKYEYLAQLVGLPLLCLLLSLGRGVIGRFGDLFVIGIAHAFNTLICILLYVYLRDKAMDDELVSELTQGSPGGPGHAAMLMINGTENEYFVKTPFYESPHPIGVLYLAVFLPKGSRSFDLVEIQPEHPALKHPVEIKRNKRYRFLTIGTKTKNTKLIQVFGDDDYKVRAADTVVVVMNGIVGETINGTSVPVESKAHVIEIEQFGRSLHLVSLPPSDRVLKFYLPTGDTRCSYSCKGDKTICGVFQPAKIRVRLLPFTEITWVITNDGHMTHMKLYSTLYIPPDEIVKLKRVFTSTYSLAGLVQSATTLGYTQFFWTESPVRLRTTLYAIFLISNELVKYITYKFVTSVSVDVALGCIFLSTSGLIVHLGLGLWYDLRFRRETWLYPKESSMPDNLQNPK